MRHGLSSPATLSCVALTNASPTAVSLFSLHQSVLIFQRFAAANTKSASISLSRPPDVRSAPSTREYCSDRYATVLLLRSWDGRPYVAHEVRVGWCELIAGPSLRPFPFVPWAFKGDGHILWLVRGKGTRKSQKVAQVTVCRPEHHAVFIRW